MENDTSSDGLPNAYSSKVDLPLLHGDETLLHEALDRDGEGSSLREKMNLSYEVFVELFDVREWEGVRKGGRGRIKVIE